VEVGPPKTSTRGDIAAAGIGYAAGFVIDNYFFPGGLSGGIVAAVAATGAVGVKNLFHALWTSLRKSDDQFVDDPEELEEQSEKLLRYIERIVDRSENPKEHPLKDSLDQYERLFTYWSNGLIGTEEFYTKGFVPARSAFRAHLDTVRYVWVGKD